ncbi:glycosyltransferase family 2 protein [soil metagenome]
MAPHTDQGERVPNATGDQTAPAVDVVIATRDRPELLCRAVAAVLSQRYPGHMSVIAVFDQSAPEEALALDETTEDGHRRAVRVTTNARTPGLAGARNTGILEARSELVAFCDDDDLWLPGKLALQVALLAANPEVELVTAGVLVDAQGRNTPRVLETDRITYSQLLRSRVSEAHPSTYVARREAVVDGIGLVDETIPGSYGEDYDWLLRAARRTDVGAVPLPLVKVFWHRSSFFAERWQTIIDALDHILRAHPDIASDRPGLARIQCQQAFAYAALGDRRAAVDKAWHALRSNRREPRAYLALATASGVISPERILRILQSFGRGV